MSDSVWQMGESSSAPQETPFAKSVRLTQEIGATGVQSVESIQSAVPSTVLAPYADVTTAVQDAASEAYLADYNASVSVGKTTFGEAVDDSFMWNTLTAGLLKANYFDPDPEYKHTEEKKQAEAAAGLWADAKMQDYLAGARSEQEYLMRFDEAKAHLDFMQRSQNTHGLAGWAEVGGSLLGGMADPVMIAATLGTGVVLKGLGTAYRAGSAALTGAEVAQSTATFSRTANVLRGAAEGAVSNMALDATVQNQLYGHVEYPEVIMQGVAGAVLGGAGGAFVRKPKATLQGTVPDAVIADDVADTVIRDAAPDHPLVQQAASNLDEIQAKAHSTALTPKEPVLPPKLGQAADDPSVPVDTGDLYTAPVGATLAPSPDFKPVRGATTASGVNLTEAEQAVLSTVELIKSSNKEVPNNKYQKVLDWWYKDTREGTVLDTALSWMDSVSLRLQLDGNDTAAVFGNYMVESPSGIGVPVNTASQIHARVKSELVYPVVLTLKRAFAEWAHAQGGISASVKHAMGGATEYEQAFSKLVWNEMSAERVAHLKGVPFKATDNVQVRNVVDAWNNMQKQIQDLTKASGSHMGEVMGSSTHIGHTRMMANVNYLAKVGREAPAKFKGYVQLLKRAFDQEVIEPGIAKMVEAKDDLISKRLVELENRLQTRVEVHGGAVDALKKLTKAERKRLPKEAADRAAGSQLAVGKAKAELAEFKADPEAWFQNEIVKLRKHLNEKSQSKMSNYMGMILRTADERGRGSELRLIDLSEDLLGEEFAGGVVTPDLAKRFRDHLAERALDRTRRELPLRSSMMVNGENIELGDIFEHNIFNMIERDGHHAAGEISLSRIGMNTPEKRVAWLRAAEKTHAKPETVQLMRDMIDALQGTGGGVRTNAMFESLYNLTYAAAMGMHGISTASEVAGAVTTIGIGGMMKMLGSMGKQIISGEAFRDAWGKPTQLYKEMMSIMPGELGLEGRLRTARSFDEFSGQTVSGAEQVTSRVSKQAARGVSAISLANMVSEMTHRAYLPYATDEIVNSLLGKASPLTPERLQALVPKDSADRIVAMLNKHSLTNGKRKRGTALNLDKWEDQFAAESMVSAIQRNIGQTFNHKYIGEGTTWSQSHLGRLLTQFRSYPMLSAEKNFMRNAAFGDGGTAKAAVAGIAWGTVLYYTKLHSQTIGMDAQKKEEFFKKRTEPMAMMLGVLNYVSASGILGDGLNAANILMGSPVRTGGPAAIGYFDKVKKAASTTGAFVAGNVPFSLGLLHDDSEPQRVPTGNDLLKAYSHIMPGGNSLVGLTALHMMQDPED